MLLTIAPIVLFAMFFVKKYEKTENISQETNTEDNPMEPLLKPTPKIKNVLIGLMALLMMSYECLEVTFMTYNDTFYQCIPLKISAQKAAQLMSMFSGTFTAGRLFSAFIACKLRADIMIIYHIIIIFISLGVIYFGQNSEPAIYVGTFLIGKNKRFSFTKSQLLI